MENLNMHRIVWIFGILVAFSKLGRAQNEGVNLYSKRYEHLNIDTILSSPRLVMNYVDCLLNKKPCPPEGKDLKRILPEALRTKCSRCWPSQKEGAIKVITRLYYNYPDQYNALREKWDPTGEYHRRFEEYLRDQQFNQITDSANEINGDQSQISVTVSQNNGIPPTGIRPTANRKASRPPVLRPRIQTTTPRAPTSIAISPNLTQRPTRQDTNSVDSGILTPPQHDIPQETVGTRFGFEFDELPQTTTARAQKFTTTHLTTKAPPPPPSTTVRFKFESPTHSTSSQTVFYTRNPILNLINRISMKFTNTADFIAGMLRNKVKTT